MWDVFISHASEDKEAIARPLAQRLQERGYTVWFDEHTLRLGDSLRGKIDQGLANSRFAVVILSPSFFAKEWPQLELDGLAAREVSSGKVILPVWHEVDKNDIARHSPILAGKLAVSTTKGIDEVVRQILEVVGLDESNLSESKHRQAQVTQLRFRDCLKADPITAKVAVQRFYAGDKSFTIKWPQEYEDLLAINKKLLAEAQQYYEPNSAFVNCSTEIVGKFIDSANASIEDAEFIRNGVEGRVPLLLEGMTDYWGKNLYALQSSLCNFLTLANFHAQHGLAYTLTCPPIYKKFCPQQWKLHFKHDRLWVDHMRSVFQIDEPLCTAEVRSISGNARIPAPFNRFWVLKSMAYKTSQQTKTDSWFSDFLIPQIECQVLFSIHRENVIHYKEELDIIGIVDESSKAASPIVGSLKKAVWYLTR